MKNLLLFFLAAVLLTSCNVQRLSSEELALNPYRKRDILVFKDSKNNIDTIKIKFVKRGLAKNDALDFFPSYHSLLVVGVLTNKKHEVDNPYKGEYLVTILSIEKHQEKLYLNAHLHVKDDMIFYLTESINVPILNDKVIHGVKNPDSTSGLQEIYFSRKNGFVKYKYKDEESTDLISHIRDGKNILINQ